MVSVRESVDAMHFRIGPNGLPGPCGFCGKALTRGGAGAPCAGEAEGRRPGQRRSRLRPRRAAPVAGGSPRFSSEADLSRTRSGSPWWSIGRLRGMANRQIGTVDVVCSPEGFRTVPSPDPRSGGFGPLGPLVRRDISLSTVRGRNAPVTRRTGNGPHPPGPSGDSLPRVRPRGRCGAKLRSCFQVRGAWPAPRGVRSVVSAARYVGFPGPAYLTPHYLANPVGNYNNIQQSPRKSVFRGTNTCGRSKRHRKNRRGRRRRFRQTAPPLTRPPIPCREWPRPWPPRAWR